MFVNKRLIQGILSFLTNFNSRLHPSIMPQRHGLFQMCSNERKSNHYPNVHSLTRNYSWGGPPAVALFATSARYVVNMLNMLLYQSDVLMDRYKREAYRGSEFAPRVLADNNISVIMKVRYRLISY